MDDFVPVIDFDEEMRIRIEKARVKDEDLYVDGADYDQWTQEEEDQMRKKFQEFVRQKDDQSLRWDFEKKTIQFDDNLNEEEYWELCFKEEYKKVKDESDGSDPDLLLNIHTYIFYCTRKWFLGSDEYPDDQDCLDHFTVVTQDKSYLEFINK